MRRPFIITIDTEGDSLWDNPKVIKTHNARNLPRFQALCDRYGFKPVYLTDYEMICDDWYVDFAARTCAEGRCEIGLHIHAWNSPPFESSFAYGDSQPFLSEFPPNEIREKVRILKQMIEERAGVKVVSHRAGRWGLSEEYAEILLEEGIRVDCSMTPYVNWTGTKGCNAGGPDFSEVRNHPFRIGKKNVVDGDALLEVPVTIAPASRITGKMRRESSPLSNVQGAAGHVLNRKLWLRPSTDNLDAMLGLVDHATANGYPFLEFILHSSELSAGLNPTFKTDSQIDDLYGSLEVLFSKISEDYVGYTLAEFEETSRDGRDFA
ncbi:hypothetical protein [Collinsella sp. HCP3S3_D1]|uniref:hypothetical protein n=1 Tax=Collinsella sp. HCP3S3_D1 TaxID=3438934 RepID=UPI003F8A8A23